MTTTSQSHDIANIKQILDDKLQQCTTFQDVLPFLNNIPVSDIKGFISQQINQQFNYENVRRMKLLSSSINEIIPLDVINCHIFPFLNYIQNLSIFRVNKQWNKLLNQHIQIHYKKLISMFEQQVCKNDHI